MDFRQTPQPNSARPSPVAITPVTPANDEDKKAKDKAPGSRSMGKWMKIFNVVMLIGIAVLLAAITFGVGRGQNDNEFKYVNQSKYQAVFLNNGQVYFGNIDSLNDKYVHMTNIYYLQTSTGSTSSSSYNLVKLGCQQIHDPLDAMVINRDQVTFWENLQDNGQVVLKINQFKKQYPKGPDCTQVTSQTQASSTAAQGSATDTSTDTTNK